MSELFSQDPAGLFAQVHAIVRRPTAQWGCDRSTDPKVCDFILECIKMQEVARSDEETNTVMQYRRKAGLMATARICNADFVGACAQQH